MYMRTRLLGFLFLLFLLFAPLSFAEAQESAGGFLNGNQFEDLPEVVQLYYVMGMIDGMAMAPSFGAPMTGVQKLFNLGNKGISGKQFHSICKKFLEDHPEKRHESMPCLVYEALARAFHWPK